MTVRQEGWRIFRKDIALLWPRAALFAALLAWLARRHAGLPPADPAWYTGALLETPFLAACFYMAAKVIHAEAPLGDCPYWVTRPFSASGLLAAKALALAALLNLPVLGAQFYELSANGVSPLDHVSLLVWRQIFFTARLVLPAAALAAVTAGGMGMAMGAVLYLAVYVLPLAVAPAASDWGGWEWIRATAAAPLTAGVSAAVLWMQYRQRATTPGRLLLAAAALALTAGQLLPWHAGFTLQKVLRGESSATAIRIAWAAGTAYPGTRPMETGWTGVALPIEVAGISGGPGVLVEGVRAALQTSAAHWDSGWLWAVGRVLPRNGAPSVYLSSDGRYWLAVDLPEELYRAVQSTPVHLEATLALTLLADPVSTELDLNGPRLAAGAGVCWTHPAGGLLMAACSSPLWGAARSHVRVQSQSTGKLAAADLYAGTGGSPNYGPYPTGALLGLWQNRVQGRIQAPPFPIQIVLDASDPAGFVERTVKASSVRLPEYVIPASGR